MEPKVIENRKNITDVMSQREDFLIVALTGRMGSGCSTVGDIFTKNFDELNFLWPMPGIEGMKDDEERETRILAQYANSHWLRFERIRVRSVITSFLLEDIDAFIKEVIKTLKPEYKEKIFNESSAEDNGDGAEREIGIIKEQIEKMFLEELDKAKVSGEEWEKTYNTCLERLKGITDVQKEKIMLIYASFEKEWNEKIILEGNLLFEELYQQFYDRERINDRRRYMESVDSLLDTLVGAAAIAWKRQYSSNLWERLKKIDDSLFFSNGGNDNGKKSKNDSKIIQFEKFVYTKILIETLGNIIHRFLKMNCREDAFSALYQKYGNKIRKEGYVFKKNIQNTKEDIFQIPRKINRFIKVLRHPFDENKSRPVRILIDSLKNVFEAMYLRYRYTAFYLMAISADDAIRESRLTKKDLNQRQMRFLNWNEYPSIGVKVYLKASKRNGTLNELEKAFADSVNSRKSDGLYDAIRQHAYTYKLHQFYLQDVEACIQNADIFISNSKDSMDKTELIISVVRDISLIMCPGLIQPTAIERCMQIAYAAKANSGCLSRQVGAVVTDKQYNILSVGWNDPPCGEVTCARKNLIDISNYRDKEAYSEYEWNDPEFRQRIRKYSFDKDKLSQYLHGLPFRYCFKDFHLDTKNPMRSRSMHAEEKALAAINGDAAENGSLFTTSSPCEMCTKNTKNHKIKNIYYIELYPGISESQYSHSGASKNQANHILYTGAVGRAYTQMYTPIMPYKDMMSLLGIEDFKIQKRE